MENKIFTILIIILLIFMGFIYILINPPVSVNAKLKISTQIFVVRIFCSIMLIFLLFGFSNFFYDVSSLSKKEDEYLKISECRVIDVKKFVIFSFVKKDIICEELELVDYFTFNSYYENEKFIIKYLPKSKIIVKAKLISSPYEKRMENDD